MQEKDIQEITNEITRILLKKNEDYGSASFDLGLNGNMVHLWDKIKRYRTIIENSSNNKTPNYETLDDTLRDIIGYGIIGLIISKKQKNEKEQN